MLCLAMVALPADQAGPDWVALVIGLVGGLALFLYGMDQMTGALKGAAGGGLKAALGRATGNRVSGVMTGMLVTAVTQSSSVTTVLLVGFVSAGLMSLQQTVAVIMGANIGSTFTAQIIAFDLTQYALGIVAVGFGMGFAGRLETVRRYGSMVLGFGLLFFGMKLMSDAMGPLRVYRPFVDLMAGMDRVLLGLIAGAVFTAVVQSSAATTGLVIVMAAGGLVTLQAGIAMALGANVGTCATAALASIGRPRVALQATLVHVLFNVAGVVIWLPMVGVLAGWVQRLSDDPARQIAHAHTLFNVVNMVLFIGLTGPIAVLVQWMAPVRPSVPGRGDPKFLDPALLSTPALAMDRLRMETGRMARMMLGMLEVAAPVVGRGGRPEMEAVRAMDGDLDRLHEEILDYVSRLGRVPMTPAEEARLGDLLAVANYLENMGDAVETNMVAIGQQRIEAGVVISRSTGRHLGELYEVVSGALNELASAIEQNDAVAARRVIAMKRSVREAAHRVLDHLGERLMVDEPRRRETYRIEQEITEQLRRLYYFARHAAWHVVGREQVPARTRHAMDDDDGVVFDGADGVG